MSLARGETDAAAGFAAGSAKVARWVAIAGASIGLLFVGYFLLRAADPKYAVVALFLVPSLFFSPLRQHLDTVYLGMRCFGRLGKSLHLTNLWMLACAVGTSFFGLTALALNLATQHLLGWLILRHNPPLPGSSKTTFHQVRSLAIVGMPMMISGIIFSWLMVADRTVIATFLTPEDLGHFALAGIVMNALRVFPESINQLLYPRVAHAFGEAGTSRALRRYVWIGLLLNLSLMIPAAAMLWFILPPLVGAYLPAYTEGIAAARVAILSSLFFAYSGPSVVVPVLRRNLPMQLAGLVAIALVWAGGAWAVSRGYGIFGVAVARGGATALYAVFVTGFVLYLTQRDIRLVCSTEKASC